jgi:hypothetical protein
VLVQVEADDLFLIGNAQATRLMTVEDEEHRDEE